MSDSVDTIVTTAIMPIAMLLLFVYVFGGAINTGPVSYVNYLLPGIRRHSTLNRLSPIDYEQQPDRVPFAA